MKLNNNNIYKFELDIIFLFNQTMNEESYHRNYVLQSIHNTILPSYCLWDNVSIKKETIDIRLNWWTEILESSHNDKDIINISNYWINVYSKR